GAAEGGPLLGEAAQHPRPQPHPSLGLGGRDGLLDRGRGRGARAVTSWLVWMAPVPVVVCTRPLLQTTLKCSCWQCGQVVRLSKGSTSGDGRSVSMACPQCG